MQQTIVIAESLDGRYGPQLKDVAGKFYSFGKSYKGDVAFSAGTKLSVDLYTSPKGNAYINSLETVKVEEKVSDLPKKNQSTKPEVKNDNSMSKAEWQAKDRSQMIGGLSHDAATLVAAAIHVWGHFSNTQEIVEAHKQVLEGLLKNREELK